MELLLPLLEYLVPLIALALCALAYAFGAAITNTLKTGWDLLDNTIQWLTNRAIDFAIEFTKWMAPHFIENAHRIVNYFHQLGELAHYAAHFAYRTATTLANFSEWLTTSWLPRSLKAHGAHTTTTTLVKVRTQPFTKAQLRTLEHTIESQLSKSQAATIPGAIPHAWPKVKWNAAQWRKWLGLAAGAGALAIPGSTAWERTKWKEQNKTNAETHKRFRTLNWLLAFSGAAALVAAGLAKLGLGWMAKCPNLKNIGKSFCAADLAGLIGVLGLLIAVEEGVSIEDFANAMLEVEKPIVEGIFAGIHEFEGLVV